MKTQTTTQSIIVRPELFDFLQRRTPEYSFNDLPVEKQKALYYEFHLCSKVEQQRIIKDYLNTKTN